MTCHDIYQPWTEREPPRPSAEPATEETDQDAEELGAAQCHDLYFEPAPTTPR